MIKGVKLDKEERSKQEIEENEGNFSLNMKRPNIFDLKNDPNISVLGTKESYHKNMLRVLGLRYDPLLTEHFKAVAWSDTQ